MHSRAKYFFIFAIFLVSILFLYIGWELIIPLSRFFYVKALAWAVLFLMFGSILSMPLFFWRRDRGNHGFLSLCMVQFAYFSMATTSFLFTYTMLRDLLRVAAGVAGVYLSFLWGQNSGLGILILTIASVALGACLARKTPKIKQVKIPFEGISEDMKKFKIVQLSDLHIGAGIRRDFVKKVVERVNELQPQLIVLTGDIIDGAVHAHLDSIAELSNLKADCGVFYVPGNHEYYWNIDKCLAAMCANKNIHVLLNNFAEISWESVHFVLAGVTDVFGGNFSPEHKCDPKKAIALTDPMSFKILLAHQPGVAQEAAGLGYHLQISGHTHGGQFFPWTFVVKLFHPVDRGLKKINNMWVYVSCGTGSWGPWVRLGAPAEITSIRFTS